MDNTMPLNLHKYTEHANKIINDLGLKLGYPDDKSRVGRVLKTTLHTLRELLTAEESVQLLAQLPLFIKTVYVDGWSLKHKKEKIKNLDDFINRIKELDQSAFEHDFENEKKAEKAIKIIFNFLAEVTSKGEIDDIKAQLPKALKDLARKHIFIEELNKATMI
jgi:uncharacterized protein (DUF2267 family)